MKCDGISDSARVGETDDRENEAVQRCLGARDQQSVTSLNACEQNAHWKRRLCGQVHDRRRDVQACVRDATFIPPFVERGPGSDQ
jgi:hypothetical protein